MLYSQQMRASKSVISKRRCFFVFHFASAPRALSTEWRSSSTIKSAENDYRERGCTGHRKEIRIDPCCFSHRASHHGSFFLSLVIIITRPTCARERDGESDFGGSAAARRRRMWSSRRVWSDVCLVCGGMRKTGSLYVLHARRLSKPSPSLRVPRSYARIYTCVSMRIRGVHARVCHSDTNVYPRLCPKLQSRASHHVRCYYTLPRYDLFFPFRDTRIAPRRRRVNYAAGRVYMRVAMV